MFLLIVLANNFKYRNSGMGLWYPEIQNRLGSRPEGDRMTICQVIDAAIEEQQGQNKTNLVSLTIFL